MLSIPFMPFAHQWTTNFVVNYCPFYVVTVSFNSVYFKWLMIIDYDIVVLLIWWLDDVLMVFKCTISCYNHEADVALLLVQTGYPIINMLLVCESGDSDMWQWYIFDCYCYFPGFWWCLSLYGSVYRVNPNPQWHSILYWSKRIKHTNASTINLYRYDVYMLTSNTF